MKDIFKRWSITPDFLTAIIDANPSLRGMLIGYIAEQKLRDELSRCPELSRIRKDDDHDREGKGDLVFDYRGRNFRLEVKCLDTNSVKIKLADGSCLNRINKIQIPGAKTKRGKPKYRYVANAEFENLPTARRINGRYSGKFQCNASDSREVALSNGRKLATNCLVTGEFDILAVCLFAFRERWEFAFARNDQLPRSKSTKYPEEVRRYLLSSSMSITWPLNAPYAGSIFPLLDQLLQERPMK